ncbi:unnamed protein product [Clonostachys chloroleuca]|uniref:Uncharacterized protein n=1 Tax=Clonostachys chloroleuca TaxID=1926264 RepID=A0AA35Q5Q4_9HYPO|nr:unnamed protein product [Clonostachys chloroleuca]
MEDIGTLLLIEKLALYQEAEKFLEQVTEVYKRLLGKEVLGEIYPDTISTRGNLALSYSYQGYYKEAEVLEERVIRELIRTLGVNLALIYYKRAKYKDVKKLVTEVLTKGANIFNKIYPTRLSWLNNLAVYLYKQEEFDGRLKLGR